MFYLVVVFLCIQYVSTVDYCKPELSCNGGENSACKCVAAPTCSGAKPTDMTDIIREAVEDRHNEYREKLASGSETRLATKATNMYALEYDEDLEYVATCWNMRCQFGHDTCRATEKFQNVGQNLYVSSGSGCDPSKAIRTAVDSWYEEITAITPNCLSAFGTCQGSPTGHFTQVVWAPTTHVGCSIIEYTGQCQVACNYGPAGNFMGEPVLKDGEPASECKFLHDKYKNLCTLTQFKNKWQEKRERAPTVPGHSNHIKGHVLSVAVWFILILLY